MPAGGAVTVLSGPAAHERLPDTAAFLASLQRLAATDGTAALSPEQQAARDAFRWAEPFTVARAPGRMDVMGGIADYSGALVLQMPIAEACHVAIQLQKLSQGQATPPGQAPGQVTVVSFLEASPAPPPTPYEEGFIHHPHRSPIFRVPLADLFPAGRPLQYEAARAYFTANKATSWAAYVLGCLLVLAHEEGVTVDPQSDSIAIVVSSEVPEGKGVSSSAAVETATMTALVGVYGLEVAGRKLAIMCQQAENLVVGAPCGIMDQMASALGQEGRLLALLCQPAEVQGCVDVPPQLGGRFWGIDSGIRHSVGGADYGSVRVGAFMGLRIARQLLQGAKAGLLGNAATDCLANIPPSLFLGVVQPQLPESILGSEFKQQYGDHLDSVTTIKDDVRYAVRMPATHPVLDHNRVQTFRQLLLAAAAEPIKKECDESASSPNQEPLVPHGSAADGGTAAAGRGGGGAAAAAAAAVREERLLLLGELMFQTHDSYGACGLGCDGCDSLVNLVREEMAAARAQGHALPVFGAKITGGGSGGTVCILAAASTEGDEAVQRIAKRYTEGAKLAAPTKVFQGSSMGAVQFGALTVQLSLP